MKSPETQQYPYASLIDIKNICNQQITPLTTLYSGILYKDAAALQRSSESLFELTYSPNAELADFQTQWRKAATTDGFRNTSFIHSAVTLVQISILSTLYQSFNIIFDKQAAAHIPTGILLTDYGLHVNPKSEFITPQTPLHKTLLWQDLDFYTHWLNMPPPSTAHLDTVHLYYLSNNLSTPQLNPTLPTLEQQAIIQDFHKLIYSLKE